jgi:hypothetical protein
MKFYLEIITIAHPGEGSGRAANVTQSVVELPHRPQDEVYSFKEGQVSGINNYELIATRGGGKVEIFRNIIAV